MILGHTSFQSETNMRVHNPLTGTTYFSKRRRRFEEGRRPHELTFSCYHRYQFLSRDRTREWFVEALEAKRRVWPIDLWAWVIMPEHVHLIVAPREPGVAVGRFVGSVKEAVSRRAVAWLREHSPQWLTRIRVVEGTKVRHRFWQPGGGYDRSIDDPDTLEAMIQYIHQNPVRRGMVERAEDFEWSSARWYAGLGPWRMEMDRSLPMLEE
jgi:putative transposase